MRGINLGGWLVLERWMTPSLFEGYEASDEYQLCTEAGKKKLALLEQHRETFITKSDFQWIAKHGFDTIRLPVGHWLFESPDPYVECAQYVDKALQWAKTYKLQVIIDLHTAPGSQNGWAHSGKAGDIAWHTEDSYIDQTIDVVSEIAEMYGSHPNLCGIELLNEPKREISLHLLKDYYRRAYHAVRTHANARVAVIINDAYRPIAEWQDFVNAPEFENMLLDIHLYQTFDPRDKKLSFDEHITKTLKWRRMIDTFGADKLIIGEWSVVLNDSYDMLPAGARDLYRQTQEYAFQSARGQFYWSYKTENKDNWSYRAGLLDT